MNIKLQPGEEVLVNLKPAPLVVWYWLLGKTGVFFIGLLVLAFFSINFFYLSPYLMWLITFVVLFVVIGLGFLWFKCIANAYHYVVTSQRVIIRYGFIALNQRMIPLSQINDVNMQSTFFERLFGLGSVYIDTLGTLLGPGSVLSNAIRGGGNSSRGGLMNNTSRLEGLTYAQCDEVMNAISSHIQKLKTN